MGQRRKKAKESAEFVQIDAYMIPAAQAEMYRVLREAVAEDVQQELVKHFPRVERLQDEEEGEAIVAFDGDNHEVVRFYLNPANISQAQKARDKGQIDTFLEQWLSK